MPAMFVTGAVALLAGLFLGWRAFHAYRSQATVFPFIEIRRVTKQSDSASFWFAVSVQAVLAVALLMFALPLI